MRVLNLLATVAATASVAVAQWTGSSLALNTNQPSLTFQYSTWFASNTNWVALYDREASPVNGKPYTTWAYAKYNYGNVFLDVSSVSNGEYSAYLLANNGYTVLAGPVPVTVRKPGYASSFAVSKADKPITFTYNTESPDPKNWIAIYDAKSTTPTKGQYITWSYAADKSGKVLIDGSKFAPGTYIAYFLSKNGYTQLSEKLTVVNPGDTGPVSFMLSNFTTQNARQADKFSANIAGLINRRLEVPAFTISSQTNASWVSVDAAGTLSGTPNGTAGNATVVVQATLKDGSSDKLTVTIPVVAKGEPLVKHVRFLTMNLWIGGAFINDFHRKQVRFLGGLNVDLVAFQETAQTAGQRLAAALGWNVHYSGDTAVLSRYPLTALNGTGSATEAEISFDGQDSKVIVWSAHLGYTPYGPYDFCQSHMTQQQVFAREAQSGRTPQIIEISNTIKGQLQSNGNKVPVFLAGDFNAPSHLDWTDATKDQHCGVGYTPWPSSIKPMEAGLTDSFRKLHPDPQAYPANSWSPVNPPPAEPQDRIDFIYYGGGTEVTASGPLMIGTPHINPDVADNEWPSDHKAFFSEFDLKASAIRA